MRARSLLLLALASCTSAEEPAPSAAADCKKLREGRVTLAVDVEPIAQSRLTARFVESTVSSRAPLCTTTKIGACTVKECVRAATVANTCVASEATTSAGSIDVKGGKNPPLTMTSDGKRAYAGFSSSGPRWAPGDTVDVTAAGADVAGFAASLVFPSRVELTGPADYVAKKDPIPVDWKAGLPLTWKPGVGTVWLHLSQGDAELRKSTDIECEAESASGAFTIPAEALATLEGTRDTRTANATLDVAGRGKKELVVGGYAVVVEALHREEPRRLVVALDGVPAK